MRIRAAGAGAVLALVACRSIQPVPVEFIPQTSPAIVYLADSRGLVQGVVSPRLSGDTVYGTNMETNQPVAVPLRRVEQVAAERPDRPRTVLLVGGLTALGALVAYAVVVNARGSDEGYCDYDNQPNLGMGDTECGYPGQRPGQLRWGS